MKILRQVTLDRASRRKDKSVSIAFTTELEQTSDDFIEIDQLLGTRGLLYFKSQGELTTKEIDELDNVDLEISGKTKSQRLRGVMYAYFVEKEIKGDFKDFYSSQMENIIQRYKDKIDN